MLFAEQLIELQASPSSDLPARASMATISRDLGKVIMSRAMLSQDSQATAPNASLHDVLLSIETYLHPAWLARFEAVKARLSTGSLVVIRDAFQPAFAERMFRCLDVCTA